MGTLRDLAADDLVNVFGNTDDFAEAATYVPKPSGDQFAVTLCWGDPAPAIVGFPGGEEDRRTEQALGRRATIIDELGRDPQKGDQLVVASGARAGTWVVQTAQPDEGDGIVFTLVKAENRAPGHQGAREQRT